MFKKIQNPVLRGAVEWLVAFGLAALLFFVVRGFLFRTAHVDGNSMAPTLEHGDIVVLNRLAYRLSRPQAGDIVAFPFAGNPSEFYIKRVIALPGDTVNFLDGFFYVNHERLDDYFSQNPTLSLGDVGFPIVVEEGHFFVLGDNRNGSQDSRFVSVGNIPRRQMVGRAGLRVWPLGRVGRVE
ncbi:MAG: signal peptidase I [Defluviitaleaceae bacterium]|nr:signal peptidase I [Defluviitaleaceae bacterium]